MSHVVHVQWSSICLHSYMKQTLIQKCLCTWLQVWLKANQLLHHCNKHKPSRCWVRCTHSNIRTSTKLCRTRFKHRVRKGRQRARWTELTCTLPKHACLFDLCRRRWRRGWMLTYEGRGAVCRSMWGVTLVSRWEGFPAMFLKISEVSLSKYECLKKKERVPVNRSGVDWLNVVV